MSTRLALVLLAACGGGGNGGGPTTGKSPEPTIPVAVPVTTRVAAPALEVAGVTSTDESPPPIVVLIDGQGQRRLAAAASWNDVGISAWTAGPKTAGSDASHQTVLEAVVLGTDPKTVVDAFSDYRVGAETPGANDDPPPPEEEDDESGGTGTAMALEEGKMGRKPSAPSGPWRGGVFTPGRYAKVVGEVSNAKLQRVPAVVIADPATKAAVLVKAVIELEAMIGVWNADQLRPLRIQFHRDRDHERELAGPWLDVELHPSVKLDGAVVELTTLKPALDAARQRHKLGANATIDVLVGPEADAQSLVSLLAHLDRAGVTSIGLGLAPTEAERKANLPPVVAEGQPNAQGDLDKAIIRRFVKQNLPKIRYCYEKELLAVPNLQGTVQVQFFIAPSGKVASASGAGVNANVASCVAAVIKGIEFPKPKGGGGVQVNYPFTFRPEGANQKP